MRMTQGNLSKILPILETLKDREMQAMTTLMRDIAAKRAQLSALDEDEARLVQTLANVMDPATQSSAARWRLWTQQERMRINSELAQLLVSKDALRGRLAKAMGRHDVVVKMTDQQRLLTRQKLARQ